MPKDEILNKFNLQRIRSTEIYELCIIKKGFDVLEVANNLFETGMFEFAYPNYIPAIVTAIQYAINKGSVVIFSAGNTASHFKNNNGYVTFPANANVTGLITVGASDRYDMQSDYSPTSLLIDVVAPSHKAYTEDISTENCEMWTIDVPDYSGINPTKPSSIYFPIEYLPDKGPNYLAYTGRFGGTSFSCAVVAGVAALILSVFPDLTPMQVHDIICNSTDKVGNYTYTNGKSDIWALAE